MYEIGRICVKIAGRDASKKCLIVDILDNNFVLIDGQTRRRKCNILHLEPLDKILKIKKGAGHQEVAEALKNEGISSLETKPKEKKEKPSRATRSKPAEEAQAAKPVKGKVAVKADTIPKERKTAKAEKKLASKEN